MPIDAEPELPADVRDRTFVVVAACDEATVIGAVVDELRACYPNVIVVDDGSADDTAAVARRAGATVLRHVINRGQGAALQTGIDHALRSGAEYVVTFDADGQHRVQDVARLIDPIRRGACEVTLGSRFLGSATNLPASRRVMLRLAVLFTLIVSRVRLTDAHNGLRGFSRSAAARIRITSDRMAHASEIIEIVRRHRLPFEEVPVEVRYTEYSLSRGQSSGQALRVAIQHMVGKVLR